MDNEFGFIVRYDFVNDLDTVIPVLDSSLRDYFSRVGFVIYASEREARAEAKRRNERFIGKK